MRNLQADVLSEFAELSWLSRELTAPWTQASGVGAMTRAYHARHKAAGLCIFCSQPAVRMTKGKRAGELAVTCHRHYEYQRRWRAQVRKNIVPQREFARAYRASMKRAA